MAGRRKPITAAELMAQLEQDEAFQERTRAAEAERSEWLAVLREAEQPIVRDLGAAGLDLHSVWDLVTRPSRIPRHCRS